MCGSDRILSRDVSDALTEVLRVETRIPRVGGGNTKPRKHAEAAPMDIV